MVLGVLVGVLIGAVAHQNVKDILFLGITMGAVMELIPRITKLFIDGLMPISEKTKKIIARKFHGKSVNIGMSPALVIGHPTTLVVTLLLIPTYLIVAVILPGNQFLPLASLAGLFYLFPLILPYTKGNVVKTYIIGLVILIIGLYFVTDMAPAFTQAANAVFAETGDKASQIPAGFEAGSMDFASSLFGYLIYALTTYMKWIGAGILVLITCCLLFLNRWHIVKEEKMVAAMLKDENN